MQLLSFGETAVALGVAVGMLRRWHRQARLLPFGRTVGGHRRYQRDAVRAALGAEPAATGKTVCYARVSSHDPAEQLRTQAARLKRHCIEAGFVDIEVISDLGSGLSCRKIGLQRLLKEILRGCVARLCWSRKTGCCASAASCSFASARSFTSRSLSPTSFRMSAGSSGSIGVRFVATAARAMRRNVCRCAA